MVCADKFESWRDAIDEVESAGERNRKFCFESDESEQSKNDEHAVKQI